MSRAILYKSYIWKPSLKFSIGNFSYHHTQTVLEIKIWIYWSDSNSCIHFYIVLNKNWKIYWSEKSFTGLELQEKLVLKFFFFRGNYNFILDKISWNVQNIIALNYILSIEKYCHLISLVKLYKYLQC
jgi:hypothetical protein